MLRIDNTSTILKCDMHHTCHNTVTHLDDKGFVYCLSHGRDRQASGIRCRKLAMWELKRLQAGLTLPSYDQKNIEALGK